MLAVVTQFNSQCPAQCQPRQGRVPDHEYVLRRVVRRNVMKARQRAIGRGLRRIAAGEMVGDRIAKIGIHRARIGRVRFGLCLSFQRSKIQFDQAVIDMHGTFGEADRRRGGETAALER